LKKYSYLKAGTKRSACSKTPRKIHGFECENTCPLEKIGKGKSSSKLKKPSLSGSFAVNLPSGVLHVHNQSKKLWVESAKIPSFPGSPSLPAIFDIFHKH